MDDDDAALAIEEVDESDFRGRLGGFVGDECCTVSIRFYRDGALEGHVTQRKKPQLHGLALLSTTRKRKFQRDENDEEKDDEGLMTCAFLQGRWMRRGDGCVGNFEVVKRRGHVDRQTLACRAEFFRDGTAAGTWRLATQVKKQEVDDDETESDDNRTESDDESVIANVFEWTAVEKVTTDSTDGDAPKDPLAVYPLAPGTYHFRGITTYHVPETQPPARPRAKQKKKKAAPLRDECFVTMELKADGTLIGKSREVVYPQSCPIRGTWEVGRLRYVLEYKVREAVGFFKYSARVGDPNENDKSEETARTLKGKWRNIDDNEESTPGYTGGRGQFELVCVHRSNSAQGGKSDNVEGGDMSEGKMRRGVGEDDEVQVVDPFASVFTTGRYILKGKAIDEDGYEYESQLDIQLFDDGTVCGTCQELVYQQVQRLHGNWTKITIQYELEYVVKKEVGRYWYQGRLESDSLVLHGVWCNMELLVDAPRTDHAVNYRGEKGTFSYAILESTRRWSHMSHSYYPKAFRERVRCILLCSQRTHVLPAPLWSKIFAFCSHEWFHVRHPVVKRSKKNEVDFRFLDSNSRSANRLCEFLRARWV